MRGRISDKTGLMRLIDPRSRVGISEKAEKSLIVGLNNAAFGARERTAAYLRDSIDKPTPFTLRPPFVHKAKKGDLVARVESLTLQDKYLSVLELGLTSKKLQTPLRGTEDKYGNLRKKFTRKMIESTLDETFTVSRIPRGMRFGGKSGTMSRKQAQKKFGNRTVKRYFIGQPEGQRVKGLWRRMAGNKALKLIYSFERTRKYRKTLELRGFWTEQASQILDKDLRKSWWS